MARDLALFVLLVVVAVVVVRWAVWGAICWLTRPGSKEWD